MTRMSATASIVAITILAGTVGALAQGAGGSSASAGAPSNSANAGGLNNSGNGNSVRIAPPPPPGTNSAGTANSSGASGTVGSSMTTGATAGDAAIHDEDKAIDQKLKSICRGC